jgi:hypothetical protein
MKTYPIYMPAKEPQGYWEWLQTHEPQPAFDIATHERGLDQGGRTCF